MEHIFSYDHVFWQFQAPNAQDLNDYIWSLNTYSGAPWDALCSVKTLQITENYPEALLQPSIDLLNRFIGKEVTLKMNRPWVSEYARGDHQEVHDHNDCDLVAVYFPEYLEGFSKFYFVDRNVNLSRPVRDLLELPNNLVVNVKAGDIIFFPGHMLHGVSVHKSDIIRRSLSCNLWIKRIHTPSAGLT